MADENDVKVITRMRCFRRNDKGILRHGLWAMTEEACGLFFHGDRDEIQTPRFTIKTLASFRNNGNQVWFEVTEITPSEALEELCDWPMAENTLREMCERCHVIPDELTPDCVVEA